MTKLRPPAGSAQTVTRERLLDRLQRAPEVKLTLIAAPAGCGKTTLLGEWHEVEATRRPTAWLTLDDRDNDPVALWSYVLAALGHVCPGMADLPLPESVGAGRLGDLVLLPLVNALAEQGDVALILDDFDRLSSGTARDSVGWLVEHAPSGFQLVLATRREPALPLAALRVRGELEELHADDLSFTPDEADELLNERLGLGLARADVDDLVARTEGWPAGLYLAALSLAGVEDRHALVTGFGGSSRHVVDFLVDEVLEAHEPATQALMLRSSVAERVCGALCDALLEQEGGAERLKALARTNLFLVPLDDRGDWFRFHPVFAQLLRVQLEHREPALVPELHRRAYAWHRAHGSPDDAIEHALKAGAFAEAAEQIEALWMHYANAGRSATVLAWLARFPLETLGGDARLLAVHAWVLALCGQQKEATRAVAAIEELGGLDDGPLLDGFSSLEASLATLRAVLPWGDAGSAYEHALRAVALEGPQSPWRAAACWGLGHALCLRGRLDEADHWHEQAALHAQPSEQWLIAGSSLAHRSLIAGELGRLELQAELAEQAATLVRERAIEDSRGEVFVALGVALAARRRPDEALPLLARGVAALRSSGQPLDLAQALIGQAATLQALGERARAAAVIADASATLAGCPDPGNLPERLAAAEAAPPARAAKRAPGSELSDRELSVLRMLTGPLSERDIARELYLSHNTIHSHTRAIYRKLGAGSRKEALAEARARGLLRASLA